jgi:hypothetical protein
VFSVSYQSRDAFQDVAVKDASELLLGIWKVSLGRSQIGTFVHVINTISLFLAHKQGLDDFLNRRLDFGVFGLRSVVVQSKIQNQVHANFVHEGFSILTNE